MYIAIYTYIYVQLENIEKKTTDVRYVWNRGCPFVRPSTRGFQDPAALRSSPRSQMCAAPEGPSRQILRAFPGVNMVQPYKNLQAYIGNALSCLYSKCIPTVEPLAVATHKLIGFRS